MKRSKNRQVGRQGGTWRYRAGVLLLCLLCGLSFTACSGGQSGEETAGQNQEQQAQEQQQTQEQQAAPEISTLTGEFQGLADGHNAEVIVDGEQQMFQFFDETVAARLETMEVGTKIQFDAERDSETDLLTIVKLYDAPAEG